MNKCVVCNKLFEPPRNYTEKKTCSKECFLIHMKTIKPDKKFLDNSFKKGHKTHNKGVPQCEWLSEKMIEKCSKTHIQNQDCKSPLSEIEGRYLPHNTLEKGTVTRRLNKHKKGKNKGKTEVLYFINIDWHGNRKPNNLLKRYLWEVHHQQDIPKGMVVYCIDGDQENFEISNLKLISRAELARINRGWYK